MEVGSRGTKAPPLLSKSILDPQISPNRYVAKSILFHPMQYALTHIA